MYSALHEREGIKFVIDNDSRLKAMSTEAAVLQCLINLVDNATYWLTTTSSHTAKTIRAFTPDDHTLVFTDDGPGVKQLDQEYIFDPFYSGKGDLGKGLGLYIARQNGLRSGFSIELSEISDARRLPGATFAIEFEEVEGSWSDLSVSDEFIDDEVEITAFAAVHSLEEGQATWRSHATAWSVRGSR